MLQFLKSQILYTTVVKYTAILSLFLFLVCLYRTYKCINFFFHHMLVNEVSTFWAYNSTQHDTVESKKLRLVYLPSTEVFKYLNSLQFMMMREYTCRELNLVKPFVVLSLFIFTRFGEHRNWHTIIPNTLSISLTFVALPIDLTLKQTEVYRVTK